MADATMLRKAPGVLRRHKVLTTMGAVAVLGVVGAISGAGGDGEAVAAVVEQARATSARIDDASGALSASLVEANALAATPPNEFVSPADYDGLVAAIAAAEAAVADQAALVTTEMTIAEAEAAHRAMVEQLGEIEGATAPLRDVVTKASDSHGQFQAAAEKAAAERAAAEKAAAERAAAEKAAAERAAAEKAAADKAASEVAGSSAEGKSSYENCADVWATIGRPIYPSDPGYTTGHGKLDGNSDGVGCENRP